MANNKNKIKYTDLFDENLFIKTVQDADMLLATVKELKVGFTELMREGKNFIKAIDFKKSKDIDDFLKKVTELNKVKKTYVQLQNAEEKINKQKAEAEIKLQNAVNKGIVEESKARQANIKTLQAEEKLKQQKEKTAQASIKTQADINKQIKAEKSEREKAAKVLAEANREYVKLSKTLNENKKISKDLLASGKELTDQQKQFIADTQELDKRLKKIDKTLGDTHREVGNYKESIREALADTGIFNNGIARLIVTLRNLHKAEQAAEGGANKLSTALKLTGIGLAILAIGAAVEIVTALRDANQKLTDGWNRTTEVAKNGALAVASFGTTEADATQKTNDYYNALIASRGALRDLSTEILKIKLNEEDFIEISNDATISTTERNKALEESIKLGAERAGKEVEQARVSLDLAQKELAMQEAAVGTGMARSEFYDKVTEKQNEFLTSVDALEDQERVNNEHRRQRHQEEIINNIELLRSNKLSANARVLLLEKQFADEKNQLEKRRSVAEQLNKAAVDTQNAEFKEFQKGVHEKINVQKLLAIQDEVQLKNYVRKNIASIEGTALETELFKIIKQSQEAQIANKDRIAKLDEEEIQRKQKLAEIEREIARLNLEDKIGYIDKARNELSVKNDKINEDINKGNNVFNSGLLQSRKDNLANDKALGDEKAKTQEQLLRAQAESDKKAAETSINDEKIRAAEIKKINEKLAFDLANLTDTRNIEIARSNEKAIKEEEAIAQKRRNIIVDNAQEIGAIINDALDKRSEKTQAELDKELDKRQQNIEKQQRLAERGLENTQAFEEKKAAEAELKKEQQKEKDIRRAKVLAYFNALTEYARQDPNSAPLKALAQIAIGEFIAGAFKDGVENFKGAGTETSDSNLVLMSKGESVATAKGTRQNPGLVTAMNEGKVKEWFTENYMPKIALQAPFGAANGGAQASREEITMLAMLGDKMDGVSKTIRNKKEVDINWDNFGEMTVKEIEKNNQRLTRYLKRKPRIGRQW